MKCKLCGKEFERRNQMHGHMMFNHRDDYKRANWNMDRLTEGAPDRLHETVYQRNERLNKLAPKPDGFRLLKTNVPEEQRAIAAGFCYIDSEENLYTLEEAKTERWL